MPGVDKIDHKLLRSFDILQIIITCKYLLINKITISTLNTTTVVNIRTYDIDNDMIETTIKYRTNQDSVIFYTGSEKFEEKPQHGLY